MQTREQLIYSETGVQISLVGEPDASQVSVVVRAGASQLLTVVIARACVSRLTVALLEDWHVSGGDPAEEFRRLLIAHEIRFAPLDNWRPREGLN